MAEDDPVEEQDFWYEMEAAKKINGLFANRIYVQPLGEGLVRINFGEVLDADPSYHSAVVVTALQAKQFAQVIFNVATSVVEREYSPIPKNAPTVPTASPPSTNNIIADILAKAAKDQEDGDGRP